MVWAQGHFYKKVQEVPGSVTFGVIMERLCLHAEKVAKLIFPVLLAV